jgi:metal-responsive CopG/Arc/MetJ family transcriptional regulator
MDSTAITTTIQLTLPSELYSQVEEFAGQFSCSPDDVVRTALEEFTRKRAGRGVTVLDLPPLDLGETLMPLSPDDDLLDAMLEGKCTDMMVASVQISDEDVRELQDLTRQSDVSEAIHVALKEYVRYMRRMQLKALSGRVEMTDNWREFEAI